MADPILTEPSPGVIRVDFIEVGVTLDVRCDDAHNNRERETAWVKAISGLPELIRLNMSLLGADRSPAEILTRTVADKRQAMLAQNVRAMGV